MKSGNYHRAHLRAPYKGVVLFEDENFVFKAHALNISEGGILLDALPHFPSRERVPFMLSIPQTPILRNFSLEKLQSYSEQVYAQKVVRVKCQMVRKETVTTQVDDVFKMRIGSKFTEVSKPVQKIIADYVERFATNLIYLQILLDTVQSEPEQLPVLRELAGIMGYSQDAKISEIRYRVNHDYKSLQWL